MNFPPLSRIERLLKPLRHLEWAPVVMLLVAVVLRWGFLELADEMLEGDTASLDESILLSMRNPADLTDPVGPRWFEEIARDVTALGGTTLLFLVTFVVVSFLWALDRRRMALYMLVAVIGALALGYALKLGFARPRPVLVPHGSHVYTHSFPSGHAMLAAATYLTLGLLAARMVKNRYLQVLVVSLAIFVTLGRGFAARSWPPRKRCSPRVTATCRLTSTGGANRHVSPLAKRGSSPSPPPVARGGPRSGEGRPRARGDLPPGDGRGSDRLVRSAREHRSRLSGPQAAPRL